jgi:hypothetical protein
VWHTAVSGDFHFFAQEGEIMKKLLIIVAILVVITVGVLIFGVSKLGPAIKYAVNTYGPGLTKTELSLGDVSISIFSGNAHLKNFLLGNPKGFTSSEAMKVGSIFIDIDPKSITGDTIVINTIEVIAPAITYEKARGTDNFQAIAKNVSSASGPAETEKGSAAQETDKGPGKQILIRDFILKQGTVTLASSLTGGKTITARLPDIHLKNIGGQGASPQKVFGEIFSDLQKQITSGSVRDALNQNLKELGTSLDTLEGEAKKQAGGIKDTFKGLFGK